MIHIVLYKDGVSLKAEFLNKPLSISERHALYFCVDFDQVFYQIGKSQADILMYFTNDLTSTDIDLLRKVIVQKPNIKITLFSDVSHAMQAWKMDMFHFDDHPIDLEKVKRAFLKYLKTIETEKHNVLTIKLNDGTHNIPLKDIRFLLASGNYTFIHFESDKNILITKQIGQFDFLTEKNQLFQRIHRSLIINIATVKSVDHMSIHFYNCEKPLDVSASLAQKIKKLLNSK
jgi:DNA-binding LytR/AlgR family response regulator